MSHEHVPPQNELSATFRLAERVSSGLCLLLYAYTSAIDAGRPIVDLALTIGELRAVGTKDCDLRWLVAKSYIGHFVEVHIPARLNPKLRPSKSVRIGNTSCFALTQCGLPLAIQMADRYLVESMPRAAEPELSRTGIVDLRPTWDQSRRHLSVGTVVVRRFHGRVSQQEHLVIAFHEEEFADKIDDPLPPTPGVDSKDRLYRAVYRLSQSIDPPLIKLECTSLRTALYWEFVGKTSQTAVSESNSNCDKQL